MKKPTTKWKKRKRIWRRLSYVILFVRIFPRSSYLNLPPLPSFSQAAVITPQAGNYYFSARPFFTACETEVFSLIIAIEIVCGV